MYDVWLLKFELYRIVLFQTLFSLIFGHMKNYALLWVAALGLTMTSFSAKAQSGMIELYGGYQITDGTTKTFADLNAMGGSSSSMMGGFIWSSFANGRDKKWQWMLDVSYRNTVTSYQKLTTYQTGEFVPDSFYMGSYEYNTRAIRVGIGGSIVRRLNRNIHNGEWAFTMPIMLTLDFPYQHGNREVGNDAVYTEPSYGVSEMNFGVTIAPGVRYSRPFHDNRYQRWAIGVDFPGTFLMVGSENSGTGSFEFMYNIPVARLRLGWMF